MTWRAMCACPWLTADEILALDANKSAVAVAGSVPGLVAGAESAGGRRRALRAASGRWYAVSSDIAALLVEAIHDKAAGAKSADDVLLFANIWGRTYGVAGGTYTATGACTAADAQIGLLKDKIVANMSDIDTGRALQILLATSSKRS